CVQGPIFDLRLGLDVPQDEDLMNPNGIFHGMPTWDEVMSRPYRERMAAFRDPATRKALSAEAVEGTVAQAAPMTDRRGAGARLFQPALGPRAGLFGYQEAAPGAPGQERRAHRQGAGQEHDRCLPRPVRRRGIAHPVPDRRARHRSEGAEGDPRLELYRD